MRYRVSQITHDCEAQPKELPNIVWDRGHWLRGLTFLGKKPKCPYCKQRLDDPATSNWMESGKSEYYVEQLRRNFEFETLFVSKVDKRKKEFKK